ncbi:3-hydroxyacyl-ACP dehydratase FabZ family protein [Oligoflexus tunisiensis]|uniref:3-hydroxyacyl-ACP dehydratase FabZ family protein n=1 Tax=Oligoflexus tunisiensis TaxID=708132 RepID=UPI00114CC24F|nr:beta-hydroxyacyl-ACP dehydratase [Oligoflexus tunisiensis]
MTVDIKQTILEMVPQQYPFRFLDRIVDLDAQNIVGEYTFDPGLPFYQKENVVPETILIETVAQTVVVAMGLHLIDVDAQNGKGLNPSEYVTLFTDVEMEFFKPVHAGEKVQVRGTKQSWRFRKIRSQAELYNEQGELIARGTLSGMGVKKQ